MNFRQYFQFGLRDIIWLTIVVALLIDRSFKASTIRKYETDIIAPKNNNVLLGTITTLTKENTDLKEQIEQLRKQVGE